MVNDFKDIHIIKKNDDVFPKGLLDLKDCPEQIYALGNIEILNEFFIGIVGARKCAVDSLMITKKITSELVQNKINIVSGLAVGVDSEAHCTCIENGGKTVAVLGGGLDKIYPRKNYKLAKDIIEKGGVLISEYPNGTAYLPRNLHNRNRLIAAVSKGVLIIEAKKESGSLITARFAEELKRKVFVLPGSVNDIKYEGSNQLLVEGKFCVRNAADIMKKYDMFKYEKRSLKKNINISVPKELIEVFNVVSNKGTSIEEICESLNIPVNMVLSKLTILEIKGFIIKKDSKFYKNIL